jgi:hypothetical protein
VNPPIEEEGIAKSFSITEKQKQTPQTLQQTAIGKPKAKSLDTPPNRDKETKAKSSNTPPNRYMKTKSRVLKYSAKPRSENHQQTPQTLRPTVI